MGIIKLYNKITIEIDNRANPAQINMKVEHETPLPQVLVILHALQGQLLQQLLMGGPPPIAGPAPVPAPPEEPKAS